jgi:hypothetical protein
MWQIQWRAARIKAIRVPRRPTGSRLLLSCVVGALVLLLGATAWAFWTSTGTAAGAATTGTLDAPTGTTVSSVAGSGAVSVSWSAPTSGVAPSGYRVSRSAAGGPTVAACGTGTTPVTTLSCTDSAVPDGTYTYVVTAVRASWTAAGAGSGPVTVTTTIATTTTVASSASPAVVGQTVTYTATVTQASGATKPPGTVSFRDGSSPITCAAGSQTLSNGSATCSVSYASTDPHTITVVYPGSGVFTGSTSSPLTQQVAPASTTTTLTSSANPSQNGQTVTFTATVVAVSPGAGVPTGSVAFKDGTTTLTCASGSQVLDASGTATCTLPFSAAGTRSVVATYSGSASYSTSSSGTVSQTVNAASTATALGSSANPSRVGQPVTYTATVTAVAPGAGTPTGTVAFRDGATAVSGCGAQVLNAAGVATCQVTYTAVTAGRTISATYAGTTDYTTSTSPTVTQVVVKADTTTSVSSSQSPARTGATVTFTATVSAVSPGSGAPSGKVAFGDGSTPITCTGGNQTLTNGSATCQTSFTTTGARTITAVYAGDAGDNGSTSPNLTQRVVNGNVAGISFTGVTVGGAAATFSCTGTLGSPGYTCATTGGSGNNKVVSGTPVLVGTDGTTQVAYATDAATSLSWSATGKTPGTGTVSVASGASQAGSAVTATMSGNNAAQVTVTLTDGSISYTAILRVS